MEKDMDTSESVYSFQNMEGPGPAWIPAEVIKVTTRIFLQLLLSRVIESNGRGQFTEVCKRQLKIHKTINPLLINKGKRDFELALSLPAFAHAGTAGELYEELLELWHLTAV